MLKRKGKKMAKKRSAKSKMSKKACRVCKGKAKRKVKARRGKRVAA